MDIAVAIRGYELDLQAEHKSPRTITWYLSKLRYFVRFLENEYQRSELEDVEAKHIKAFVRQAQATSVAMDGVHHLKEGVLSSQTVRGYFVSIKAFLAWAEREGYVDSSPASRLRPPKTRQVVIESLTPDEIRAMLKATPETRHSDRNYAMLLLLYDTGIRVGELVGMAVDDIDFAGGWIKVRGKGDKERMVPMGETTRRALWRYVNSRRPEPLVPAITNTFLNERREGLGQAGVYRVVRSAGERAGIRGKRLSPHTMRHSAAQEFLRNGGDAFALQKLLGHTTLTVTRQYVALVEQDLQNAHRRASPGDNLRVRQRYSGR